MRSGPTAPYRRFTPYRERQIMAAFVCIAKGGAVGVRLSELAAALGLTDGSTPVDQIVQALVDRRLVVRRRSTAEPHAPVRITALVDGQKRAGALSFEDWKRKQAGG